MMFRHRGRTVKPEAANPVTHKPKQKSWPWMPCVIIFMVLLTFIIIYMALFSQHAAETTQERVEELRAKKKLDFNLGDARNPNLMPPKGGFNRDRMDMLRQRREGFRDDAEPRSPRFEREAPHMDKRYRDKEEQAKSEMERGEGADGDAPPDFDDNRGDYRMGGRMKDRDMGNEFRGKGSPFEGMRERFEGFDREGMQGRFEGLARDRLRARPSDGDMPDDMPGPRDGMPSRPDRHRHRRDREFRGVASELRPEELELEEGLECPRRCTKWFDGCNVCQCENGVKTLCTEETCDEDNPRPSRCLESNPLLDDNDRMPRDFMRGDHGDFMRGDRDHMRMGDLSGRIGELPPRMRERRDRDFARGRRTNQDDGSVIEPGQLEDLDDAVHIGRPAGAAGCVDTASPAVCASAVKNGECELVGKICARSCGLCDDM